ncbi:hypothetical protein HGP16_07805 [Rhizobium sp. P40RR-XXII]|uniref:hypothetical protein n=1 Tax=unclassified Rhizobium TaxID=2613769 RepID=UPI001456563B|nr:MULTISPECIES: hypothetical protein [unclassified Rhizobium]NLR84630.1 hypothetical protein [Rhizobium sp. P28RR-XV]NLS16463.1 hypothetical protein [Rhizobium sp. P40RR-XXII]
MAAQQKWPKIAISHRVRAVLPYRSKAETIALCGRKIVRGKELKGNRPFFHADFTKGFQRG